MRAIALENRAPDGPPQAGTASGGQDVAIRGRWW